MKLSLSLSLSNAYRVEKSVQDYLVESELWDSLISGWILNSGYQTDSTLVKDLKGTNNLTPTAITYETNAAVFNGTSSKILHSAGILSDDHTILVFFKANPQAQYSCLVSQRQTGQVGRWLISSHATTDQKAEFFHSASSDVVSATNAFNGLWNTVQLNHDGARISMRFNGDIDEDNGYTTSTAIGNYKFCIGANTEGADGFLTGRIAAVFVFSGNMRAKAYSLYRNINALLKLGMGRTVLIGSSTMAGNGASAAGLAWARIFEAYENSQGRSVVNLAVAGTDTYQKQPESFNNAVATIYAQNVSNAITYNPDLVIFGLPSNNVVNGYTDDVTFANFARMKAYLDSFQIPCLFTSMQPRNLVEAQRNQLYGQFVRLKATYPANYVDFWTWMANADYTIKTEYNADDDHPNDAGHAVMAEKVLAWTKNFYPRKPENLYTGYDESYLCRYTGHVESVASALPVNITLTSIDKVADLITYLRAQNLWKGLIDGYVFKSEQNYKGGEMFVSLKGRYPLFKATTPIPVVTSDGALFNGNAGLKTRAGLSLCSMPFSVLGYVKAGAQTNAYSTIFAQHESGGTNRFLVGTPNSAGSNDMGIFHSGGIGDATSDNNFFDGNMRSFMCVHSGARFGMYLNESTSEVFGGDTEVNVGQFDFSVGANFEGAGPNFFEGTVAALLVFNSALNATYDVISAGVDTALGIGAA